MMTLRRMARALRSNFCFDIFADKSYILFLIFPFYSCFILCLFFLLVLTHTVIAVC